MAEGKYGSKTIDFPSFPKPESITDMASVKKWASDLEEWHYKIEDIIQELNRRRFSLAKAVLSASKLYIASYSSTSTRGTGWYDCTVYEYLDTGEKKNLGEREVLNLIDEDEGVEGLASGHWIICWKITDGITPERYAGVEFFGRTTIGLCS